MGISHLNEKVIGEKAPNYCQDPSLKTLKVLEKPKSHDFAENAFQLLSICKRLEHVFKSWLSSLL